jgi:hypothetical protein
MGIMHKRIKILTIFFLFFITLSSNIYSMDELGNTEMAGLVYLNVPFGSSDNNNFSPKFGFTVARTRPDINNTYITDVMPQLTDPNQRKLVDIQFDLQREQLSRFAFGGIDALVYDDTLHVNGDGGGPVIDPALLVLGIGTGGIIYLILSSDDNNNGNGQDRDECNGQQYQNNGPTFTFTMLNFEDNCVTNSD